MPKKFRGENTKAVEARSRKAAVAESARQKKETDLQEAFWADDDKKLRKKHERKVEKDTKKAEILNKKKENEELYKAEMESLPSKKPAAGKTEKVTRSQISLQKEKDKQETATEGKKANVTMTGDEIQENINKEVREYVSEEGIIEARTIEDAITALGVTEELDRHPERRMKAAYAKFEEENMPMLKKENPNLRQSQLKQILRKDWQKCPDNPMNQRFSKYNTKS